MIIFDDKEIQKKIGENIRNIRTCRGLTIEEVSEYLGVSAGYVGLIERGQRGTKILNILKLSILFKSTVDELIGVLPYEDKSNLINDFELILRLLKFDGDKEIQLMTNIVRLLNKYLNKV